MATIGTHLRTWLTGKLVGADAFGNRYYRARGRPGYPRERRWVIYKGEDDASRVPPQWHAWLHYVTDEPPLKAELPYSWVKPHEANKTGTDQAYRPPGSVVAGGRRARATADYEPWTPP